MMSASTCSSTYVHRSLRAIGARCTSAALLIAIHGGALFAQSAVSKTPEAEQSETLTQVTALQNAFVERIHAAGFTCPIAVPKIVIAHVPSFGQYDDETNTLRTTDWSLLSPEEKAFFVRLVGPGADDSAVRAVFEKAAHGWIFVHEMGHWWQACQGFMADHSHYQVEYGANRIALAYWREKDPEVVKLMMSLFHGVLDHTPSPVPAGQGVEEYFDKNYETLGPSPAYPWFQSQMGVSLEGEKPVPALAAVLAATKK